MKSGAARASADKRGRSSGFSRFSSSNTPDADEKRAIRERNLHSVATIIVPKYPGAAQLRTRGTGTLVRYKYATFVLTNHHLIPARHLCPKTIMFEYKQQDSIVVPLLPELGFYTDKDFDVTLIFINPGTLGQIDQVPLVPTSGMDVGDQVECPGPNQLMRTTFTVKERDKYSFTIKSMYEDALDKVGCGVFSTQTGALVGITREPGRSQCTHIKPILVWLKKLREKGVIVGVKDGTRLRVFYDNKVYTSKVSHVGMMGVRVEYECPDSNDLPSHPQHILPPAECWEPVLRKIHRVAQEDKKDIDRNFMRLLDPMVMRVDTSKVTKLDIPFFDLLDSDISIVGDCLKVLPNVTEIYLRYNSICSTGACMLSAALGDRPVKRLDMNSNRLGDSGAAALIQANVESLNLSACRIGGNNLIFTRGPLSRNTSLTHLHLANNGFLDEGIKNLCWALEKHPRLQELYLDGNKFGYEGAAYIATLINRNSNIERISLAHNRIGSMGAKCIAKVLCTNRSITYISVRENNIGPAGARELAAALSRNTVMTGVYLDVNPLGDSGVASIAQALCTNSTVVKIGMEEANITNIGAHVLALALRKNSALKYLYLGGNMIQNVSILVDIKKNVEHFSFESL